MCQKLDDKYIPLNDGAKVYYANTACKDDTSKSELLQLFLEKKSFDNKNFPNLSEAVKYYKDDEKGVSEVCKTVEKYAEEYAKEQEKQIKEQSAIETALRLIKLNLANKDISFATNLSVEKIQSLRNH